MRTARVLVTGAGGPAGRSLSRQLIERGCEVVGVDMEPVAIPGIRTRVIPAATDPSFRSALTAVVDAEGVDMLIPTVSEELPVLARSDPWSLGVAVVASRRAVSVADDKWLTCRRLAGAGIPVPRFGLPSELPSLREITERLGLPYLSKPRTSRGARGVVVRHTVETGQPLDDAILLQEFAPGTEYAPNVYIAEAPEDDVVVVLEKRALSQGIIGNALEVRRVQVNDVARLARDAARVMGLTGPVDIDVRRRADGSPVVLEINARFGANSSHAPEVLTALLAERMGGSRAMKAA